MPVSEFAKAIVEEMVDTDYLKVGHEYWWRGKLVRIISGSYWGTSGVSNFWHWREVGDCGVLGAGYHGYADHTEFEEISN